MPGSGPAAGCLKVIADTISKPEEFTLEQASDERERTDGGTRRSARFWPIGAFAERSRVGARSRRGRRADRRDPGRTTRDRYLLAQARRRPDPAGLGRGARSDARLAGGRFSR